MLPRWHIILGAVFCLFIFLTAPNITFFYLSLIFLSSFLIDFDHYVCAVMNTGKFGLISAFDYHNKLAKKMAINHRKGIRKKYDFHLFHTVEFHVLFGIAGIFLAPFFYIFIGMIFHSLLDLFYLLKIDYFYAREYFFFNWLAKRF